MVKRVPWRFAILWGLLILGKAACGQSTVDEAHPQNPLLQDARLKSSVSLSVDRIYLGDLLERLTAETKVGLSIDFSDRSSNCVDHAGGRRSGNCCGSVWR